MRQQINDHPWAVVLVMALTLGAATTPYWWARLAAGDPGPQGPQAFFYDLNTNELFVASAVPGPIETPTGPHQDGPAGVRAHVFACGRCADLNNRFVGWLSKPVSTDGESEKLLVKRTTDADWVPVDSAEGARVIAEAYMHCDPKIPVNYCHPEHGY